MAQHVAGVRLVVEADQAKKEIDEVSKRIQKLQEDSTRASPWQMGGLAEFINAQKRVTEEFQKQQERIAKTGIDVLPPLTIDPQLVKQIGDVNKELEQTKQELTENKKLAEELGKGTDLSELVEQLGGISTALVAIGTATATALFGFGMIASRIEELNNILEVTTNNAIALAEQDAILAAQMGDVAAQEHALATAAGMANGAVQEEVKAVRALHLSGIVANEAVAQMIRYDLDWTRANELAREAQDAATYAMQDSSRAMNGLIQGIITLQPRLLRTYGIMINLDIAYEKWATANNVAVKEMTVTQRQQAALNEVLAKAPSIAGAYEAAMGTAAKQVRSLKTDTVDFSEAMGESLTPILDTAVGTFRKVLRAVVDMPAPLRDAIVQVGAFSSATMILLGSAVKLIPVLLGLNSAIIALGGAFGVLIGLGTYIAYLQNLKEAHKDEAAAVAASSTTYDGYKYQIDQATLDSYELTEQLWEQVKAQDAVNQASMAKALSEELALMKEWASLPAFPWLEQFLDTGKIDAAEAALNKLDIMILRDRDSVTQLAIAYGKVGDERYNWINAVLESAPILTAEEQLITSTGLAIQKFGDQADGVSLPINVLGEYLKTLADKAGLSVEEVTRLRDVFNLTEDEIVAIGEALNLTNKELVDLAMQSGIAAEELLYLRDSLGYTKNQITALIGAYDDLTAAEEKHNDAISDLTAEYNQKALDLATDRAKELAEIDEELAELHGDVLDEMSDLDKEYADKREDAYRDMVDALADADRDLAQDIEDANRKLQQDLEDADRDYQRDLEDAAQERIDDIADMEREAAQDRDDMLREFTQDMEDIERDHQQNLAEIEADRLKDSLDANEKYQKDILEINARYAQEKLDIEEAYQGFRDEISKHGPKVEERSLEQRRKDLMSEYRELEGVDTYAASERRKAIWEELFKLEKQELEALDERKKAELDALKKALEEEEAAREEAYLEALANEQGRYEEARAERERQYQQDLADLVLELEREREEIELDYQRKLDDLRTQHDREREEIQRNYRQKLEDLAIQHAQEEAEIQRAYEQKLAELAIQLDKEREAAIEKLEEQRIEVQKKYAEQAADLAKWYADRKNDIDREYTEQRTKVLGQIQQTNREAAGEFGNLPAALQPTYDKLKADAATQMYEWAQIIIKQIQDLFAALGAHSPSTVMMDLGESITSGLLEGMGSKDIEKELDNIFGKQAMNMNIQAAMNGAMGTTTMPAAASMMNSRTTNQNLNITAQYQKVQSETSLRDDLALWNMMMRQ